MEFNPFKMLDGNFHLYPDSFAKSERFQLAMGRTPKGRKLLILGANENLPNFEIDEIEALAERTLFICPLSPANAEILRQELPWLQPTLLGLKTSVGMGDRLGLATAGHVRALKKLGGQVAPIFAQQSIREMMRTHRTAQQVMDDATWGTFQEGWHTGVGADADHLKTFEDIEICLKAGYTFFTIDPGDHVHNLQENENTHRLKKWVEKLPEAMAIDQSKLSGNTIEMDGLRIQFSEEGLLRAMVKYASAIWHVVQMYRHLTKSANGQPFELEVSVDETEQPTTHLEHYYIAHELRRLGVEWVSLAPRYVGRFEKGVDYIGDLQAFEQNMKGHAVIARAMGPYKLSLHSGSDKFSIYPIAMQQTGGFVHLKTAGTSYLEALHTLAIVNLPLLKEIYSYARSHYEQDRKSYHVSAELKNAPSVDQVDDWITLLNQFDAREIFHVTFGSVLTQRKSDGSSLFYDRMMETLNQYDEVYSANLEAHFVHHIHPFLSA